MYQVIKNNINGVFNLQICLLYLIDKTNIIYAILAILNEKTLNNKS